MKEKAVIDINEVKSLLDRIMTKKVKKGYNFAVKEREILRLTKFEGKITIRYLSAHLKRFINEYKPEKKK